MIGDKIIGRVSIDSITYYKDDWGVVKVAPVGNFTQGEPKLNNGLFTICGKMVKPILDREYDLIAEENYDPKYHEQYEVISLSSSIYVDEKDGVSKRKYLEHLFTERQVRHMYEALNDPFMALKNKEYDRLVQITGCGTTTAVAWVQRFEENYIYSRVLTELADCELTMGVVKAIVKHYKSPEIAINKIRENPYSLVEVGGIGFAKADGIALKSGIRPDDPKRVAHYIYHVLNEAGKIGKSFLDANGQLLPAILEFFGEDIPDELIMKAMHSDVLKDRLWMSEDHKYIGLKKYYIIEDNIANEILRLRGSDSKVKIEALKEKLKSVEREQGWEFTEQQKKGIETLLENNMVVVEGRAGTGKTSLALAIIKLLGDTNRIALTAFAGKAAMRLSEVAGVEGYTIHRLLGYKPNVGFTINKENQLNYDVIIVDEISMIGGELFLALLEAVPNGTKLILLGDTGQLEAIGSCNVAADLISSGVVPVVTLDKIHRQAAKSAIITESLKIRAGSQIIGKDWAGIDIRGEYKDLVIECYSDASNTYPAILEYYQQAYEAVGRDLSKLQVIVPIKSRGAACVWNLNQALQEFCNPGKGQAEIDVYYPGILGKKGARGTLREGDKVINTKNNYHAIDENGRETAVFNGNMGIIKKIDLRNEVVSIDFYGIGTLLLSKSDMSMIHLGYAITVHKFQGSQAEVVIFGIDFSSMTLLSRELIYTGITRAQKKCILVAQNTALRYATSKEAVSEKQTHLRILFYNKTAEENL